MSVTITITDPSSTPAEELRSVIAMLRGFTLEPVEPEAPLSEAGAPLSEPEAPLSEPEAGPVLVPPPPGSFVTEVAPEATAAFGYNVSLPENRIHEVFPPAQAALFVGGVPVGAVAPASVELDKDGLPWDGRIHASTKTKTVEGVWKKKRNVEPSVVLAVEAELRAVMAVPAPPALEQPQVPAPPAPIPPPAPPAGITFAEFMAHVTAGVTSSRFTREDVAAACVKSGVPNLPGLINRPDLIPAVARELGLMA